MVTLALLSAGLVSGVVALTVAVLVVMVPGVVPGETLNTNWNDATAPLASEAIVQVTAPVPPAAGVVQLNAGPAV